MKSSTATGTTATASAYRGRFAPSPTGQLHKGSLLAALASWLDARAHGGTWLIRIEDLDTPRVVAGAAAQILTTLERFGMTCDEPVLYQSARGDAYRQALRELTSAGLTYRCRCTRGERSGPGACKCRGLQITDPDCAWRLHLDAASVAFEDHIQGHCEYATGLIGDPVIFRRDGLAAYQLAVAVDDAFQGITHVVRGADLLESTAWQIALLRTLRLAVPRYAHIPLLTEPDGTKLSKSRRSLGVHGLEVAPLLAEALGLLGINVPDELKAAPVSDMLHWSVQHWSPVRMNGIRAIALPN